MRRPRPPGSARRAAPWRPRRPPRSGRRTGPAAGGPSRCAGRARRAGEPAQDDVADRAGEHVHRLVDEHVVGAADAADARRGAAARAGRRGDDHVVGGTVAQHRGGLAGEGGVDGLALGAVLPAGPPRRWPGRPARPCTERWPQKCMPPSSSHSAHSSDMTSPSPMTSCTLSSPQPSPDLLADLRLAEAGFAAAEQRSHAQRGGVRPGQLAAPVGQVGAERAGGQHRGRLQARDRPDDLLGGAPADPGQGRADAPEPVGVGQTARHPRQADQVGDDVVVADPGGVEAGGDPVTPDLEVGGGQGEVEGIAGGARGGQDLGDAGQGDGLVAPERLPGRPAPAGRRGARPWW